MATIRPVQPSGAWLHNALGLDVTASQDEHGRPGAGDHRGVPGGAQAGHQRALSGMAGAR